MRDIRKFKSYCKSPNELRARKRDNKEVVILEEANRSESYANTLSLAQAGDVLLFYSAFNLMHTYVKQDKNKKTFGRYFKSLVTRLFRLSGEGPMQGARLSNRIDRHNPLVAVVACGV